MKERRFFKAEVRKVGGGRKIMAKPCVVFNQRSEDLGGYVEQIDPAAFTGCDMSDVRCLFNHSDNLVLGRSTSKTLLIEIDRAGLNFECDPPDTSYARDLAVSMDRGDINQCSFSFAVPKGGAIWSEFGGLTLRTVKKISRLFDVSVVTYPAYPQTSSEIRTAADILSDLRRVPAADYRISLDHLRRKLDIEMAR